MALIRQQFISLPYPTESFGGKTVIVTGSNTGLGKEAARHIVRLGATTLILAVRSLDKGEAAKQDIESSTGCGKGVIQVWHLDLTSYDSVLEFVRQAHELERVDALIANAAIAAAKFKMVENDESTLTVNVISTFLLVLAMLPKMKETSQRFNTTPTITVTSSGAHEDAKFEERSAPNIFAALNDGKSFDMMQRYPLSKLLEVYCVKHIGEEYPDLRVTINDVDPGFCHSELSRDLTGVAAWMFWAMKLLFARSTEYGSRTLVHAAGSGPDTHGQYMSGCKIATPGKLVVGEEGKKVQQRVWNEVIEKLEKINPGILEGLTSK